jgi:hypothetical protein
VDASWISSWSKMDEDFRRVTRGKDDISLAAVRIASLAVSYGRWHSEEVDGDGPTTGGTQLV